VNPPEKKQRSVLGVVGALWGVLGLLALLGRSVIGLAPMALEPFGMELQWWHWVAYVGSVIFMAYSEGYKGFQKGFSPRVIRRGIYLAAHPTLLRVLLAPAFCMGLFHASKKRLIVSWSVSLGVFALVMLVRSVAQPWRGIIDAGVVVGLSWGTVAIVVFAVQALVGNAPQGAIDLPGEKSGA